MQLAGAKEQGRRFPPSGNRLLDEFSCLAS